MARLDAMGGRDVRLSMFRALGKVRWPFAATDPYPMKAWTIDGLLGAQHPELAKQKTRDSHPSASAAEAHEA